MRLNHHLLPKTKASIAALFASLEKNGVPAREIQAIQSMKVELESFIGDSAAVSAITKLTYNCPCSAFSNLMRFADWN